MHRIWKEVLIPAPVQFDARGRRFSITPEHIHQAHRNANLMLSRGVPIPCVFEHVNVEAGDTDEWKARYAKHCFGHIGASRISTPDDVRSGVASATGTLLLRHDVVDPDDVKRLRKVKFVSPKIYPGYRDSRGGTYQGTTVSHSALTPTPVQFWQRPFALSATAVPPAKTSPPRTQYDRPASDRNGSPARTSYARSGRAANKSATPTPVQFWQRPFELSRSDALYLSYTPPEGSAVPDDKDGGDKGKGGGGDLSALMDALRGKGLTIPDEVTDIPGLIIAIKAGAAIDGGGGDADLDLDDGGGDAALSDTTAAGNGPMLMSMTDPRVSGWVADERKDTLQRVKALFRSGRIDRPTARQLQRQAQAVEMSFTAEAVAVSPLHVKLTELEKRAKDSVWSSGALDLSATHAGDPAPAHLVGQAAGAPDPAVLKKQEELAARHSVAPRK